MSFQAGVLILLPRQELSNSPAFWPYAVTVNNVRPGIVNTQLQSELRDTSPERFPYQNRFANYYARGQLRPPEEAAQLLLWLSSSFTDDMTVQTIDIGDEAIRQRMAQNLGQEPSSGLNA